LVDSGQKKGESSGQTWFEVLLLTVTMEEASSGFFSSDRAVKYGVGVLRLGLLTFIAFQLGYASHDPKVEVLKLVKQIGVRFQRSSLS
jgi:inner membrane protein involved in colicin E2 resistance